MQSIINCRWRHSRWGGRATFSAGSLHSKCPLFKGASCRVHNGLWRWQWPILNHLEATAGIEMLTCYTNALGLNKEVTSFILMLHVHPHISQFPAQHTSEMEVKSATPSIYLLSNNIDSTTKFIYAMLRDRHICTCIRPDQFMRMSVGPDACSLHPNKFWIYIFLKFSLKKSDATKWYLIFILIFCPASGTWKRKALGCIAQYRNSEKYIFVALFLSSKPTQSFLLYLLCLEKIFNFCNILSYYQVFVLCRAGTSKFG